MTVRYTSTSPGARYAGVVIDDEFTAVGWQTAGHRVGRFRRALTARERNALERALRAARDADRAPEPRGPRRPGGVTEQVIADGGLELNIVADPPPGFARLVNYLRARLEDLAESPVAAVELEVSGPRPGAVLRHVGDVPLAMRVTRLTLIATVFGPDSAILDSATHSVDASGVGDRVGPGWTLALADELDVPEPAAGGFTTVTVSGAELDVLGDGVLRAVEWGWMSE